MAYSEWDALPDERWTRKFDPSRKKVQEKQDRVQPKRMTKRERQERDAAMRRRRERERQIAKAQEGLSAEEIERRREERRIQRREAAKKKKENRDKRS